MARHPILPSLSSMEDSAEETTTISNNQRELSKENKVCIQNILPSSAIRHIFSCRLRSVDASDILLIKVHFMSVFNLNDVQDDCLEICEWSWSGDLHVVHRQSLFGASRCTQILSLSKEKSSQHLFIHYRRRMS